MKLAQTSTFSFFLFLGRSVDGFQVPGKSNGIDGTRAIKYLHYAKRHVSFFRPVYQSASYQSASWLSNILQAQVNDDGNDVDAHQERHDSGQSHSGAYRERNDPEEESSRVSYEEAPGSISRGSHLQRPQDEGNLIKIMENSPAETGPVTMTATKEEKEEYKYSSLPSTEKALLRYKQSGAEDSFLFDAVTGKLSVDELYDLAVIKSRPKKKPISLHSFLASMSAIVSAVVLLPTFSPGLDDYGLPQIFEYNQHATIELLWQCQFCALLQMISSIMGVFRLPKNSPSVRTTGFIVAALIVVQVDLVILSSLNGTNVYLFDAFSSVGRVIMSTMNTVLLRGIFDTLSLVIGDKDRKGWETVPGYESRISAIITTLPFFLLAFSLGNASLPILGDEASFQTYAIPFYSVFPGVQTLGYLAINLAVGLGALIATLQFEKKIPAVLASVSNIFISVFLMFDGVKFAYLLSQFPDTFPHSEYFTDYTPQLQSIFHTNETLFACTVLAVVKGLQNLQLGKAEKKGGASNQENLVSSDTEN